ncbi:MAG TPA: DUF3365 domain-containing protein [Edaphocola sp.]|nr:DUF3365 domain-containing protein [Edaphocola sp.]
MRKLIILISLGFLCACNTQQNDEQKAALTTTLELSEADYLKMGDDIANQTQTMLMANVANAIKSKGVAGAVDFCNEKAIPLTDSFSEKYHVFIQRLSDKNRNEQNAIQTELDQSIWEEMSQLLKDTALAAKHIVKSTDEGTYYYKAINIAMPTCLSCHGSKKYDISAETLKAIAAKYPNDKATGYKMGDFRGMWKIKLN